MLLFLVATDRDNIFVGDEGVCVCVCVRKREGERERVYDDHLPRKKNKSM